MNAECMRLLWDKTKEAGEFVQVRGGKEGRGEGREEGRSEGEMEERGRDEKKEGRWWVGGSK